MNRIASFIEQDTPLAAGGFFSPGECFLLHAQYSHDPSNVNCPACNTGIRVLAFIRPEIDAMGFAEETTPEGEYAVAIYCRACDRAVGLIPSIN